MNIGKKYFDKEFDADEYLDSLEICPCDECDRDCVVSNGNVCCAYCRWAGLDFDCHACVGHSEDV